MNIEITEFHKTVIQKLNETSCPYLVRDFINDSAQWTDNHLNVWLQYPTYPEDIYVIQKSLVGRPINNKDAYSRGGGYSQDSSSYSYIFCEPYEISKFQEEYQDRVIVNFEGTKINFLNTSSVSNYRGPKIEIDPTKYDFLSDIASLNMHNVKHLVAEDTIEDLFFNYNDSCSIWVDVDRNANLRLHNAFQYATGNAPGVLNFLSPMSIKHGKVLWTNYDEHLEFEKFYTKRKIYNICGIEVNIRGY